MFFLKKKQILKNRLDLNQQIKKINIYVVHNHSVIVKIKKNEYYFIILWWMNEGLYLIKLISIFCKRTIDIKAFKN